MHQRKILLLENVASQAAEVREQLSLAGFQVAVSRYEADGFKRLAEWRPDLVLISTAHPAGDFVEYCRRVRALTPAARIIVTSSLDRERLFQEHPGLQAIVDGILVRPYSHEEVAGMLALAPEATPAPRCAPAAANEVEELRAEFQHQLEVKFLEVEELKRRLEAAGRPVPSGDLVPLQEEHEELRRAMQEASKNSALALAAELLKRSEIEVKLDNLLRMKEDFEFRAQNEIEERDQEIEQLRGELRMLREAVDRTNTEHEVLRGEMERALVEKEQIEERLHGLESGPAPELASSAATVRIAALEGDLARWREQAAAAQAALADVAAQAAVLEETSARAQAEREVAAGDLARQREQSASELQSLRESSERRLEAVLASAAGIQAELRAAQARRAELEREVADLGEARDGDERREQEARAETAAQTEELLERAERLQGACSELEGRLSASEAARTSMAEEAEVTVAEVMARVSSLEAELGDRVREFAAERERLRLVLEQRESELAGELRHWRGEAETAAHELELIRAQGAERASREADERRVLAERLERAAALETELHGEREAREVAERRAAALDTRVTELEREAAGAVAAGDFERLGQELAAAGDRAGELEAERDRLSGLLRERDSGLAGEIQGWREKAEASAQELELARTQARERADQGEGERQQLVERLGLAVQVSEEREREVASLREDLAAAEKKHGREIRLLEEQAAARVASETGADTVTAELHRIQELLEEVISRARTDAVDHARREAELSARLQSAFEERRFLQERFDRASDEAVERERRSATLLQSALDRGPAPARERANLPAIVPPEPAPRRSRTAALAAVAAAVALATVLAVLALRGTSPSVVGQRQPMPLRPKQSASPEAAGPREVWERWTRSDGSGGVLVQATLRSEEVLRAEVEAEQRSRGWSAEEGRAELARRLGTYHFDTSHYVTVYLKNFAPGYPSYLDDVARRFRLRDSSGREVPAFLPPGHEKDRRVFSFGAGAPGELIYEATVPLGFDRAGLSPSPGYLQLVVSEVGAASRRVLTWELE